MSSQPVGDDAALVGLRLAAAALADGTDWSRCDDHAAIEQVRLAVDSGRLAGGDQPATLPALRPLAPRRVVAPAPAPPGRSTAPLAAALPPPPPESTFGANLDVAAMVNALRQAAQDGVPFCEECARAAAARAAGQGAA